MKSPLKALIAASVLNTALTLSGQAQAFNLKNPAGMVASLDQAVSLTSEQKPLALAIVEKAVADRLALPASVPAAELSQIPTRLRREIRAILSPAQQRKYDRTPQINGGGLTMMSPENRLARLDALIPLSPEQKAAGLEIFRQELDELLDIPEADRPRLGMDARQAARKVLRAILTPAQREIYDATPGSKGGGAGG